MQLFWAPILTNLLVLNCYMFIIGYGWQEGKNVLMLQHPIILLCYVYFWFWIAACMNYRLCLVGGKELHNAIISSIQDLAKAFSSYNEEIMVHPDFPLHVPFSVGIFLLCCIAFWSCCAYQSKKDYLLQYARDAVNGLKLNADLERYSYSLHEIICKSQMKPLLHGII